MKPSLDVLIITAVDIEYRAVLAVDEGAADGCPWTSHKTGTGHEFSIRDFDSATQPGNPLRFAVIQALSMGGNEAISAATQIMKDHDVRCLAMCGVCAGRRGDTNLGDVVVAERMWEYDHGKIKTELQKDGTRKSIEFGDTEMFRIEPPTWKQAAERFEINEGAPWLKTRPISYEHQGNWLLERLSKGDDPSTHTDRKLQCPNFPQVIERLRRRGWLDAKKIKLTRAGRGHIKSLLQRHPDGIPGPLPFRKHVAPMASGNHVMEDSEIFAVLAKSVRKVAALEMEAAAMGTLARNHRLEALVVAKAVMDHADEDKSDNFKEFAARASAEWIIAFARHNLQPMSAKGAREPASDPQPGSEFLFTWERQFHGLLDSHRLFHHGREMLGRDAELQTLLLFATTDNRSVALLRGRGGSGKSRLICALGQGLKAVSPDLKVLYLSVDGATPQALDAIEDVPTLLIVDDAHRLDDLVPFSNKTRRRNNLKLILCYRPWADEFVRRDLRHAGWDSREICDMGELERLGREAIESLAAGALGSKSPGWVEYMSRRAGDSPLVLLIGCRLISEGRVDPGRLSSSEEFQREVLDRYLEDFDNVNGMDAGAVKKLLRVIAAISPLRLDNSALVDRISQFLNEAREDVVRQIDRLIYSGLLERRGRKVRITPDVLADHLLITIINENRYTTPQAHSSNDGFFWNLYETFRDIALVQLLRNLAELDWSLRQEEGNDPIEMIWRDLQGEFERSEPDKQESMIHAMLGSAIYVPHVALNLAETAVKFKDSWTFDEMGSMENEFGINWTLHELPSLLGSVAHHPKHTRRCCMLLWELGRDDKRGDSLSGRPMSQFRDLVEFNYWRDPAVQKIAVETIGHLIDQPDAFEHFYTPLDILGTALDRQAHRSEVRGFRLQTHLEYAARSPFQSARDHAISLIKKVLLTGPVRGRYQALELIENALQTSWIPSSATELWQMWEPELERLEDLLEEAAHHLTNPILKVRLGEILQLKVHYGRAQFQHRAQNLLGTLTVRLEEKLIRALDPGNRAAWPLEFVSLDSADFIQEEWRLQSALTEAVATDILAGFPIAEEGVLLLQRTTVQMLSVGRTIVRTRIFSAIARLDPSYAFGLCVKVLEHDDSALLPFVSEALIHLRQHDPAVSIALLNSGIALQRYSFIANALRWRFGIPDMTMPNENEVELIKTVLKIPDVMVRNAAIDIIGFLADPDPDLAKQLLLELDIGDQQSTAKSICMELIGRHKDPSLLLDDEIVVSIVEKLRRVDRIDNYHVISFLDVALSRTPGPVIEMLLQRVESPLRLHDSKFEPLPSARADSRQMEGLLRHSDYLEYLRMVRDRSLTAAPNMLDETIAVFRMISGDFRPESMGVLQEWVNERSIEKLWIVAQMISDGPLELLFRDFSLIESLLEAAEYHGNGAAAGMVNYMIAPANREQGFWTLGASPPLKTSLVVRAEECLAKLSKASAGRALYEALVELSAKQVRRARQADEEWEDLMG